MTPREFRQKTDFEFDYFQELTSTGIRPNYVNIELFAHEYHQAKLKLLGISKVSPRFLAKGSLSNGQPFSYEDKAKDLKCFLNYLNYCYPTFKIDSIKNVG